MAKKELTKERSLEDRLRPTGMNHVFLFDIEGNGQFKEIVIVKMVKNEHGAISSLRYIDVALLDKVDKGRLKTAVTSRHADKYELWDLLSQMTLSNGLNGLDYFHQLTKAVNGPGSVNTFMGGGLASVQGESSAMVGAAFSDPTSASLDGAV
jgi:hypothetical protein